MFSLTEMEQNTVLNKIFKNNEIKNTKYRIKSILVDKNCLRQTIKTFNKNELLVSTINKSNNIKLKNYEHKITNQS